MKDDNERLDFYDKVERHRSFYTRWLSMVCKNEPSNRKKSSSTEDRPFPADSEFYTTTDATYVLQEDGGEEILVPFTITSPDRDELNIAREFNIYYSAERPFDDENNATWAKLEDISVIFQNS